VTRDRGYLLRVNREHLHAAVFQDGFTAGRAALQAGEVAESDIHQRPSRFPGIVTTSG
jgi:hypothetical protein